MAESSNPRGLLWATEELNSGHLDGLQSVAFHLFQPASGCQQETEISMNIKISKDDLPHFTSLLELLRTCQISLRTMEFHQVPWDPHTVRNLGLLLQKKTSVLKHLVFRKNSFGPECLRELSDIVRSNGSIKEIVFTESSIGPLGAAFLASALKVNRSIEGLQIWEDSIGLKGAEELSRMIEVNSTLKQLRIFDSNPFTASPLVSAGLARNRTMDVHVWSGENSERASKLVEYVPGNSTLRVYGLDVSGTCRVACALGMNSTVKSLDMTGVRLKSRWAKEFQWVLEQNQCLEEVILSKTGLKDKGIVYVAAGLFKNQALKRLYLDGNLFGSVGLEHLLCPLSRFSALQNQANTALKSITFGGKRCKIGRDGLEAILKMLTTNQTLNHLGIYDDDSLRAGDISKIFKSLERNSTLESLSLQGCTGVDGEALLKTVTEVNPRIKAIDLSRTPLQNAGKTEGVCRSLGQNEKNDPEIDLFKDMGMTVPKSCRVFLCGEEHAGKSTLASAIYQQFSSSRLSYIDQLKTVVNPIDQAGGMKIKELKDDDTKILIWDLGEQHRCYALHDLMFPGYGTATFFMIVCSLLKKPNSREQKSPDEIEGELQYWLRFIVSNSRRAVQQSMLPNVTVVLTHIDRVDPTSPNLQAAPNLTQKLRDKFHGSVEFYPTVLTVDGRSPASVSELTHHVRKTTKALLQRVPQVYEVCNELIKILSEWRMENNHKPTMQWKDFAEICQVKVPSLRIRSRADNKEEVETRRRDVASCLHNIGEVFYFDELGFLILDFQWFCSEVLGQLMRLHVTQHSSTENGFISRKVVEKMLTSSHGDDLLRMLLMLEMCYEQDHSDPNSPLMLPCILEDGRGRQQRWHISTPECIYVGRHLQCDDTSHTLLMPDFFPRLQVHLHNKMKGLKNQYGATCRLEKYLISISINGIYVRIELGGQLGYHVDVLACSTKNVTETLRLFQQLIIPSIMNTCHGTTLAENIIRPECVRNLTPPRFRKTQFLSVHNLKQALLSVAAEGMYDYQHTWDAVAHSGRAILSSGFDFARDLLSDDEFRGVLHCRYHDLHNLAIELQVPLDNSADHASTSEEGTETTVEPTFSGIAKGVEIVLQRLKIIEQEIRDIKQEIQGLRYYEHRLLIELNRKVNYLVNYNVHIEERKVPNMFYFVRTENYSRRLITIMIPGMNALRLHMLCEFRREIHVVEDQVGCEMMQVDSTAVQCLAPHIKTFMKLVTFALKVGAHFVAGMGEMIPNLGREVAHLLDSPLLYSGAAAAAAGAAGAAAIVDRRRGGSRDILQDLRTAQQWLVDFLREQRCTTGKDIAEKFGLWRVRYRDDGQVAWVCRAHMHMRANEIIEVPM